MKSSADQRFRPMLRREPVTYNASTSQKWSASSLFKYGVNSVAMMRAKLQRKKEKDETEYLEELLNNKFEISEHERRDEIAKTIKLLARLWVSIRDSQRPGETDKTFKDRIYRLAQSEMNRYEALRKIQEHQTRREGPDTTTEEVEVRLELSRQKLQKLFYTLGGKGYGIDMLRAEFTGEYGYPLDHCET